MKTLLGRGNISPNKPDNDGQTPLCCAARNGHERVVEILLRQGDINPSKPDKLGQTPLWWAAESGHAGVIALLQPSSCPKVEEASPFLPPSNTDNLCAVPAAATAP